jgi:hypothetical protein
MIDPTLFAADGPDCTCGRSVLQCARHTRVRSRFEIVRDYAERHRLNVAQVEALVAELPGGSNVVRMGDYRRG